MRFIILSNSLERLHIHFTDIAVAKNTFSIFFDIVSKPFDHHLANYTQHILAAPNFVS